MTIVDGEEETRQATEAGNEQESKKEGKALAGELVGEKRNGRHKINKAQGTTPHRTRGSKALAGGWTYRCAEDRCGVARNLLCDQRRSRNHKHTGSARRWCAPHRTAPHRTAPRCGSAKVSASVESGGTGAARRACAKKPRRLWTRHVTGHAAPERIIECNKRKEEKKEGKEKCSHTKKEET